MWEKVKGFFWAFIAGVGAVLLFILIRKTQKETEIVNDVPEDRVDDNGNPIPPGTEDDRGFTQWDVKEFDVGIGKGKASSVVVKNENGKKERVPLPKGVKAKDVKHVIQVEPEVYVVNVEDKTGANAGSILDVLEKKGKKNE